MRPKTIRTTGALFLAGLLATACATAPELGSTPPDYTEIATTPAPPNASLYTACFAQAIAGGTYRRASDRVSTDGSGDELLLFSCNGPPAAAMFAALGPWSARIGSEWQAEDRVWRSTSRVQRNLFGVDYCSDVERGGDARCVITFNAGDFLDQ